VKSEPVYLHDIVIVKMMRMKLALATALNSRRVNLNQQRLDIEFGEIRDSLS
jgi:hypothetical protein